MPDIAPDQDFVAALQGWHAATDAAARSNRNLLQYAGAMAALLGISAGSGGVFALAGTLESPSAGLPWWAGAILAVVGGFGGLAGFALLVLLISAYGDRAKWERDADEQLRALIAANPEHFLPKAD